ncbi:MAG: methyltransferase domain-containing protein [Burkholderiaceae bacterium]
MSEHEGVLYLHLGTEWIQGAMRLSQPDAIEIEYVQQMMMWLLFERQPRHVVQLGLGAGALTRFCHRRLPDTRVTAVELNPQVIRICRSTFALPPDDARLSVLQMDALDFVADPANHGAADVLQVDLYDAAARAPVLDTPEFYRACADCLTENGMLTANLFGDQVNFAKSLQALEDAFDAVAWLPVVHDANVVAIAFKRAPEIDFATLYRRAAAIRRALNLPAQTWVDGLKRWMRQDEEAS